MLYEYIGGMRLGRMDVCELKGHFVNFIVIETPLFAFIGNLQYCSNSGHVLTLTTPHWPLISQMPSGDYDSDRDYDTSLKPEAGRAKRHDSDES
jgi:hypothetical protein